MIEQALLAALARYDGRGPRHEVGRVLDRLRHGAGVQQVANEVGHSRRRPGDLEREWGALAGRPPTTWLREQSPFLPDLGGGDRAG